MRESLTQHSTTQQNALITNETIKYVTRWASSTEQSKKKQNARVFNVTIKQKTKCASYQRNKQTQTECASPKKHYVMKKEENEKQIARFTNFVTIKHEKECTSHLRDSQSVRVINVTIKQRKRMHESLKREATIGQIGWVTNQTI